MDSADGIVAIIIVGLIVACLIVIPILLGSLGLYICEYCLGLNVNWEWFSRWLFGIFGGLAFLKFGLRTLCD